MSMLTLWVPVPGTWSWIYQHVPIKIIIIGGLGPICKDMV